MVTPVGIRPHSLRAAGFTLLEVLVAFVIAGLALTVLTHVGLDGVRSATVAARYQEAMARAQSHLAALGVQPQPGDRQGDEGDGFHWHVRIVPTDTADIASAAAQAAPPPRITLLAVSVAISWGGALQRSVQLDSERVVAGVAGVPP